jgi:peptidoglycan/xylan/chitin deacetylase (PgdA/CDA1 family)
MADPEEPDSLPIWTDRLLPRRLIVTFHGLGSPLRSIDAGEAPYWVEPSVLAETIDLARRREIDITFDDGNDSDFTIAFPMLAEARMSSTFFVLAGRFDQKGALSRAQTVEMAEAGMAIGSHGHDHIDWTKASDDQMRRELHDARGRIEDCLGKAVDKVSIPFGAFDARVLRLISKAGYRQVYTSSHSLTPRSGWLMPRHTVQQATVVGRDIPAWTSWRSRIISGLRNELRGRKYGFSTSMAGRAR